VLVSCFAYSFETHKQNTIRSTKENWEDSDQIKYILKKNNVVHYQCWKGWHQQKPTFIEILLLGCSFIAQIIS
jgi:hypothetical protein